MKKLLYTIFLISGICFGHDFNSVWIQTTTITHTETTTIGVLIVQTTMFATIHTGYEWTWQTTGFYEDTSEIVYLQETTYIPKITDFTIIDEGALAKPSNWTVTSNDSVYQASNIYSDPLDSSVPKKGSMAVSNITFGSSVSGQMKNMDDDGFGIMINYKDVNNYYRLSIDNQRGYLRLDKNQNGIFTNLKQISPPVSHSVVSWGINSGEITVNGTPFYMLDSTNINKIGYYVWGSQGCYFWDLKSFSIVTEMSISTTYSMGSVLIDHSFDTSFVLPFEDPTTAVSIEVLSWSYDTISQSASYELTISDRYKYIYKPGLNGTWELEEVWKLIQ